MKYIDLNTINLRYSYFPFLAHSVSIHPQHLMLNNNTTCISWALCINSRCTQVQKHVSYCSNGEPRPKFILEDFGYIIIKVSLWTLANYNCTYLIHTWHGIFSFIHITYAYIMLLHIYHIYTYNMQNRCTNKEWSWAFPYYILTLRIIYKWT